MVCIKCFSCDTLKSFLVYYMKSCCCWEWLTRALLISVFHRRPASSRTMWWHSQWLHVNFDLSRCLCVESKCECAAGMLSSMFSWSLWMAPWESIIVTNVMLVDFLLFWHQLIVVNCTLCVYIFLYISCYIVWFCYLPCENLYWL